MKRTELGKLSVWRFGLLDANERISHFVTDRLSATQDFFSLSYSSHPDRDMIEENRSMLADAVDVEAGRLYFPSQVHGTRIHTVTSETTKSDLMDTDALITNEPGVCIAVMSADCVPVLLFDKAAKAIAAVHAGWRGTVASIVRKTLTRMNDEFGTKGSDIIAAIGPSICAEVYEVGQEVIDEFDRAFGADHELLNRKGGGKAMLDLWKANTLQLLDFGVRIENIEVANLCTVKHNEFFFSARKGDKGRFAAGILLK